MYANERQERLLEQQREQVEQLRREASVQRIQVSKALEEIRKYIGENQASDILLMGFTNDKHNPYRESNSCALLWISNSFAALSPSPSTISCDKSIQEVLHSIPDFCYYFYPWCCQNKHTVRNLHFLSKKSTLISRENCRFFGGEKVVKMLWFWTF